MKIQEAQRTTTNPGSIKETTLLLGDCLDKLKELDDNSIDSIVSDPPYGLEFMGKKWDYDVPSQEIWEECIRVLKPGGHLLSFAGSRTYHRMAVRIEDAGFEIRDQIMWIYGSGFPKSHNIGKSIDKMQGNQRQVVGTKGLHSFKGTTMRNHYGDYNKSFDEINKLDKGNSVGEGWGTALKPAHEPIVMARKPIVGTVANNVLEYGVGGINIDGCRVSAGNDYSNRNSYTDRETNSSTFQSGGQMKSDPNDGGRFPANIILDEEAGRILDEQSGITKGSGKPTITKAGLGGGILGQYDGRKTMPTSQDIEMVRSIGDSGGASRFFYCPKANKTDRNEGCDSLEDKGYSINQAHNSKTLEERYALKSKNNHPTVKPTDLMQYLIRLVTPKGGIVLDPFMGSGSTGKAAIKEGMIFVGIEREEEYYQIAKQRIGYELDKNEPKHNFW